MIYGPSFCMVESEMGIRRVAVDTEAGKIVWWDVMRLSS